MRRLLPALIIGSLSIGSQLSAAQWKPKVECDGQLFPSLIISLSTIKTDADGGNGDDDSTVIGDPKGILGIELTPDRAGSVVRVTIEAQPLIAKSTFQATLPTANQEYTLKPKLRFDYDALLKVRQQRPLDIVFTVQVDADPPEERIETVPMRPINDCIFGAMEDNDAGAPTFINTMWLFAAYVNENHPWLEELRHDALAAGVVQDFAGYQKGTMEDVLAQVFAYWAALSAHGVRYSNIVTTVSQSNAVFSQHVRLLDETVENAQANCVDGSVLFASALRKVGIDPFLVLIPGHCFVGFWLDAAHTQHAMLETTRIGTSPPDVDIDLPDEWQAADKSALLTFAAALQSGQETFSQHADFFEIQDDPSHVIVDIAEARRLGIMPIPYLEE